MGSRRIAGCGSWVFTKGMGASILCVFLSLYQLKRRVVEYAVVSLARHPHFFSKIFKNDVHKAGHWWPESVLCLNNFGICDNVTFTPHSFEA